MSSKHTQGKGSERVREFFEGGVHGYIPCVENNNWVIAKFFGPNAKENAQLTCEAVNVKEETGCSPRELQGQNIAIMTDVAILANENKELEKKLVANKVTVAFLEKELENTKGNLQVTDTCLSQTSVSNIDLREENKLLQDRVAKLENVLREVLKYETSPATSEFIKTTLTKPTVKTQ